MTKEDKIQRLEELKKQAKLLKKDVDYYNALQLALKLVLNGSYGAFAASYFVLFNNHVASSITAQGRDLTKTMDKVNLDYWYNKWHEDTELHKRLCIRNISKIPKNTKTSIYADTDSLFVSFKPAMDNCEWKNIFFDNLDKLSKTFVIINGTEKVKTNNKNCLGIFNFSNHENQSDLLESINKASYLIVDGILVKDREFRKFIKDNNIEEDSIKWNWKYELDFIHGIDYYRYAGYFKDCLEEYANGFGVANKEDFELERISESVIYVAKKKYIQHIVYEDGIPYNRFDYIYPKGVELVRSSTPLFARDKIVDIIKYLFKHPDSFNIKELVKLVKGLKKEFDLCVPDKIDEISMQSSCSNYDDKVINDSSKLEFVTGAHFAVKASAYYNYLLKKNKAMMEKYEFIKSGTKIKYYYCKDTKINKTFAYIRGSYPIEIAPEIDLDVQFEKCILSPINSIIKPLGLPEITRRLTVVLDIFGYTLDKRTEDEEDEEDESYEEKDIYDFSDYDQYEQNYPEDNIGEITEE